MFDLNINYVNIMFSTLNKQRKLENKDQNQTFFCTQELSEYNYIRFIFPKFVFFLDDRKIYRFSLCCRTKH